MYVNDLYDKYKNIDKNKMDILICYHFTNINNLFNYALDKEKTNENNINNFYNMLFIKLLNYDDECKNYKEFNKCINNFNVNIINEDDYIKTRDKMLSGDYDDKLETYFNSSFNFYYDICKEYKLFKYADSLLDFSMLMIIKYNKEASSLSFDLDHTIDNMLDIKKEIIGDYDTNKYIIYDDSSFNKFKDNIYSILNRYELIYLEMHSQFHRDYKDKKYNGQIFLPIYLVFKNGDEGFRIDFNLALTYDSNLDLNIIEDKVLDLFLEIGEKYSYFNLDSINYNEEKYRIRYVVNPNLIMNIKYENKNIDEIDQIGIYFDNDFNVPLPDMVSLIFFATEIYSKYNLVEDLDDVKFVNKEILNKYINEGYDFIFDLDDEKKIENAFRLYEKIEKYL